MNGSDQKVTPIDEETMASAPFWLKAVVVGLGVAIIAMMGLILYRIVAGPGEEPATGAASVPATSVPVMSVPVSQGFSARDFDVQAPQGASLVAVVPAGADVFLHFRLEDGGDQVIILNRATGEQSTLRVNREAP